VPSCSVEFYPPPKEEEKPPPIDGPRPIPVPKPFGDWSFEANGWELKVECMPEEGGEPCTDCPAPCPSCVPCTPTSCTARERMAGTHRADRSNSSSLPTEHGRKRRGSARLSPTTYRSREFSGT
jgi:hypothetical protein